MFNKKHAILIIILGGILLGQSDTPLRSWLKAWLIKYDSEGKEVWFPADSARPGDIILYELTYKNISNEPIKNLIPQIPIPHNTVYIEGSAISTIPADVEFSIDGGKTFKKPPIFYYVKKPNGEMVRKKATPDMYTNIRWKLKRDLNPQEIVKLSFKVKVK